mmetsp:Transcript_56158/g.177957  ORF Transcript_56158/g.177957 Transcript_56158/m.177957 type:complete len:201 (-) Transcript_56158:686-1288(-)
MPLRHPKQHIRKQKPPPMPAAATAAVFFSAQLCCATTRTARIAEATLCPPTFPRLSLPRTTSEYCPVTSFLTLNGLEHAAQSRYVTILLFSLTSSMHSVEATPEPGSEASKVKEASRTYCVLSLETLSTNTDDESTTWGRETAGPVTSITMGTSISSPTLSAWSVARMESSQSPSSISLPGRVKGEAHSAQLLPPLVVAM